MLSYNIDFKLSDLSSPHINHHHKVKGALVFFYKTIQSGTFPARQYKSNSITIQITHRGTSDILRFSGLLAKKLASSTNQLTSQTILILLKSREAQFFSLLLRKCISICRSDFSLLFALVGYK